ncbi:MAG: helix-turn-helix transcriptional regulator [Candidatus Lokiarchaeia archaeon]
MKKVLQKIRLERFKKSYSQSYLGERIGIGQRAYGKLERGETELTLSRLQKIADALEVDIKDLIS